MYLFNFVWGLVVSKHGKQWWHCDRHLDTSVHLLVMLRSHSEHMLMMNCGDYISVMFILNVQREMCSKESLADDRKVHSLCKCHLS